MSYTITYNGVPIGSVAALPEGERATLAVEPLSGYTAVQPLVRAASSALADTVLSQPADAAALARASELGRALELRDEAGALVPTDFIELTDWPGGTPAVAAFLRLRDAHAPVPARLSQGPKTSGGFVWPAA